MNKANRAAAMVVALIISGGASADETVLCTRIGTTLNEHWLGAPDDMLTFTARRGGSRQPFYLELNGLMREQKVVHYECQAELLLDESFNEYNAISCGSVAVGSWEESGTGAGGNRNYHDTTIRECVFAEPLETDNGRAFQYKLSCHQARSSVVIYEKDDISTPPSVSFHEWESLYSCNQKLPAMDEG